jgi:hypothetical protein
MEAKRTELNEHATGIAAVLEEVCETSNIGPLVRQYDESGSIVIRIVAWQQKLSRRVTTDLGEIEYALRLPLSSQETRCWIGLHERWEHKGRHRVRFRDCGLRLYLGGEDEEAIQLLRLEWVAPTLESAREPNYTGKHAGHPHWHIDRSALVGSEDYLRSLETLTVADTESGLEDFSQTTAQPEHRVVYDCSWVQRIHLPAQAGWMHSEWDGHKVPGPHQSEPDSIAGLGHWWAGALRYFVTEFPKAAFR